MFERIRGSYDDALYKSTYTLLYFTSQTIMQMTSYDRPGTPVVWRQRSWRNFNGVNPNGVQHIHAHVRWVKIGNFRPRSRYILETVQDSDSNVLGY